MLEEYNQLISHEDSLNLYKSRIFVKVFSRNLSCSMEKLFENSSAASAANSRFYDTRLLVWKSKTVFLLLVNHRAESLGRFTKRQTIKSKSIKVLAQPQTSQVANNPATSLVDDND